MKHKESNNRKLITTSNFVTLKVKRGLENNAQLVHNW